MPDTPPALPQQPTLGLTGTAPAYSQTDLRQLVDGLAAEQTAAVRRALCAAVLSTVDALVAVAAARATRTAEERFSATAPKLVDAPNGIDPPGRA